MLLDTKMLEAVGGMDEEFFLYHEEVALCRSARTRGWRVEFDPSIAVVHLRPLQNRPISPKMRVITRHSKLLYFRKHLPAWQFQALSAAVKAEARVRAAWNLRRGNTEEVRSWRAIEQVARGLDAGTFEGGRAVLDLAETVEENPDEPEEPAPWAARRKAKRKIPGRSHGTRHLQP
jgi:GT2 family glycosyltransferase